MKHTVTFRTPDYYKNPRMAETCQLFYAKLGQSLIATHPETKEMVDAILTFPFAVDGWTCGLDQQQLDLLSAFTGSSYAMIVQGPGA